MKRVALFLILLPLFVTTAYAEEPYDWTKEFGQAYQVESALPGPGREIGGELKLDGSYDAQGALERLWRFVTRSARERFSAEVREAASLVLLGFLSALAACFCARGELTGVVDRVACCAAALLLSEGLNGLLAEAASALRQFSEYSRVLLPALFTAAAAGGAAASASARYAASCLTMDVMMTVSQRVILPLIYAFMALTISQSLFENGLLQAVRNLCKWAVTTALTVLTFALGAYLSLTGLIAASTDALAVKTARTVISKSLPIVGGLLSDSAAILLSAAQIVKNSVGVFGLIAVCTLCIGPLLLFSVKLLVYKAAAAAVDILPETRLPKLVNGFSTAFGMLAGLIGCNAALLFLSIVSGIRVVTAV